MVNPPNGFRNHRLTRTGWFFLVVAFLLYFASLTSQSGLLLMPIGILLGCFVVNFFQARRIVKNLEVVAPASAHLSEGQRMTQPWKIVNRSKSPAAFVEVESSAGTLFRIAAIAPQTESHVVPELVFERRGVYPYSQIAVSSVYPFGLVQAARQIKLSGEVIVHPLLYSTYSPKAAGFDVMVGGKFRGNRRSSSGANFAGIRPLQAGDAFKLIHWKSSSKGLGLMVKTFDEELSGRVAVIFDCGSHGDEKVLDDAVRAAGSLIFAALDAGHHVEWVDLSSLKSLLIPPFADGQEVLDLLARIVTTRGCLTADRLQIAIEKVSAKSAICLVVTQLSQPVMDTVEHLHTKGRTVSVYAPAGIDLPDGWEDAPVWEFAAHHVEERA